MRYTIEWLEKAQAAGKDIYRVSLKGEDGTITENVTIWSEGTTGAKFPSFDKLMAGSTVEGKLVPSKKEGYGPSLYPLEASKPPFNESSAKRTIDHKADTIRVAQDNKEIAIKTASTFKAASEYAIEYVRFLGAKNEIEDADDFEVTYLASMKRIRAHFWQRWDMEQNDIEAAPPFDN